MKRTINTILLIIITNFCFSQKSVPKGFIVKEEISGLSEPTDITIADDGRIFITEKKGDIRIIENGVLLDEPFYHVNTQSPNERGLDGIVLDPDFENNPYVYIYYTLPDINHNVVARVKAYGNKAIPNSEERLLMLDNMWGSWHNGGGMSFDSTGKLIIGIGDGTMGWPGRVFTYSLAKIMRINKDGTIPIDNPYYDILEGDYRAIAAYGVRNPYTMDASRRTGRIFFNDVGTNDWEEINEFEMGKDYGWNLLEGFNNDRFEVDSNYKDPIYAYGHDKGCAVVGASFYEPDRLVFPMEYDGKYFFLDNCNGKVYYMDPNTYEVKEFGSGFYYPNNLESSKDGVLYVLEIFTGKMFSIQYVGEENPPFFSHHPQSTIVAKDEDAYFEVNVLGDDVSYQWYLNDTIVLKDENSFFLTLSQVNLLQDGSFVTCSVKNNFGSAVSNKAFLTVVDGKRPTIDIINLKSTYEAGDTLKFDAIITDPDQNNFMDESISWIVEFHHNVHSHPALSGVFGKVGNNYITDKNIETDTDVFYRVKLIVKDSSGLVSTTYQDVLPEYVQLTLATNSPNLYLKDNGKSFLTGSKVKSVKNVVREIGAVKYQIANDSLYLFSGWEDFDSEEEFIYIEAGNDTIIANYNSLGSYYTTTDNTYASRIAYIGNDNNRSFYKMEDNISKIHDNFDILNPYREKDPSFPHDKWSLLYFGKIIAPMTGEYTFYLKHDGKLTFILDGDSILKNIQSTNEYKYVDTFKINLVEGVSYDFVIDYNHYSYISRVEFDWSFSVIERHSVPTYHSQLNVGFLDGFQEDKFYPNIAFNSLEHLPCDILKEVTVYNLKGQKLLETNCSNSLNVSFLSNGYYILSAITIDDKVIRYKFLKH